MQFITEVIEKLGNDSIELLDKTLQMECTKENVFSFISKYEQDYRFDLKKFWDLIFTY